MSPAHRRVPPAAKGHWTSKLVGPTDRLFADPQPGPDETSFQVDNTSAEYYESPYYKQHEKEIQPIPALRSSPPRMQLADVLGAECGAGDRRHRKDHLSRGRRHRRGQGQHPPGSRQGDRTRGLGGGCDGPRRAAGRPRRARPSSSISAMSSTTSARPSTTTTSSTSRFAPTTGRSSRSPAITTAGDVRRQTRTTPSRPTLMAFLRNFCAAAPEASPDGGWPGAHDDDPARASTLRSTRRSSRSSGCTPTCWRAPA